MPENRSPKGKSVQEMAHISKPQGVQENQHRTNLPYAAAPRLPDLLLLSPLIKLPYRIGGLSLGVSGCAYARICFEAFERRKLNQKQQISGPKQVAPDRQISAFTAFFFMMPDAKINDREFQWLSAKMPRSYARQINPRRRLN